MEFKGVKGKWSYKHEYEAVYSESGYVIADVFPGGQEANGLLISKAPEMLQMLIDIMDTLENGDTPHIYKIDELIKEATEL